MGAKKSTAVVFKEYTPNQLLLIPPTWEELIAENHPVRVVAEVIDQIDIKPINRKYKGGGTSSYHPRLLLKLLVYGYLSNVYSSRKLEEQASSNIYFMWLCGLKKPDHNTINRFRSKRLSGVLKEIFSQIVLLLNEQGIISLKEAVFTDGTKIEANANRYTFVWGKSIKTSKERIKKQLDELWTYAQGIAEEELKEANPLAQGPIDSAKVKEAISKINEALKDKEEVNPKVKQKLKYAGKHWPENLEKYHKEEETLAGRNSCSKTDPDATFMRMKEDHMLNGQLKPAYNVQISTQDQFILNYSLHQTTTDTATLAAHLTGYESLYKQVPSALVADAGYGSDENYSLLESKGIEAYIKYNYFDKEQKEGIRDFSSESLYYNPEENCLYCPMGQKMSFIGNRIRTTANGYEQTTSRYQAANCLSCPLQGVCHRSSGNRIVEINHSLRKYKQEVKARLNTKQGIAYRKKRAHDVEPVFAFIKHNRGFKRFLLRGLPKTEVEIGLLSIAHNLKKWKA